MGISYPDPTSRSAELYQRGLAVIPDGVSRSTVIIRPHPIYVDHGKGAWITDVDGNRYLDCNNNFTSIILGHANPMIEEAVKTQLSNGTAFSMATEAEVELAEILCRRISSCERMRFCNSGTEAVMGAIKAARAFTGRPAIIKVEGSYHGTYDHAEASLGSDPSNWGRGAAPSTVPYARGAPESLTDEVIVIQFNDAQGAVESIRQAGSRLAAVLLDPMPSRVGMPVLEPAFSEALRQTTREVGALLILDEVISFRLAHGGAQAVHGIDPDLTALAKIIGGGFPVGAIGGRSDVMEVFSAVEGDRAALPSGGTFTANPVTMTAGVACMRQLTETSFDRLGDIGDQIRQGLKHLFEERSIDWQVTGDGSLFRIHPHQRKIRSYRDAHLGSDEAAIMTNLQHRLLECEVYLSSYGMGCVNLATTDSDVQHLLGAVSNALDVVAA
ncbi:MAG: aspartate aminotransferase family protein [Actinomycetota bacterium]|nr:aspartate aminotransferase family protein [Actinomycetota bacterium]